MIVSFSVSGSSCSLTHTSSTSLMSSKMQFRWKIIGDCQAVVVCVWGFEKLILRAFPLNTICILFRRYARMKTRSELSWIRWDYQEISEISQMISWRLSNISSGGHDDPPTTDASVRSTDVVTFAHPPGAWGQQVGTCITLTLKLKLLMLLQQRSIFPLSSISNHLNIINSNVFQFLLCRVYVGSFWNQPLQHIGNRWQQFITLFQIFQ